MSKILLLTAALLGGIALPSLAFAGPFGLPDHQPNGFRDTGCDAAAAKPIANSNALSNPTCKQNLGYTSTRFTLDKNGDGIEDDPGYVNDN